MLDAEEDINAVLRYFSYEHFYVIYCKFWELDADHDFLISKDDMLKYGNHSLTFRILDRIFAQVGGSGCQAQNEPLAQHFEPAAGQGRLKLDQVSVGMLRWVGHSQLASLLWPKHLSSKGHGKNCQDVGRAFPDAVG